jgi:hypothetical protein
MQNIDPNTEILVGKLFIPSKTSQNGLNFLTKEDENSLAISDQSEEIIYLFKLIYLYLNEPYEHLSDQNVISYLINDLEKKYNVENLSKSY